MRSIYILAACTLFFMSCGDQKASNQTATAAKPKEPISSKLPTTGTTLLMTAVTKYYDLKNALVATKAGRADSAALELAMMTSVLDTYLKSDSVKATDLLPFTDSIMTAARAIPALKDNTCEKQRVSFEVISGALYRLVNKAGLKNAGIFHQYCPMAFNDKGAFWLSGENEIKNPYFGKKMLECGEVTDSL